MMAERGGECRKAKAWRGEGFSEGQLEFFTPLSDKVISLRKSGVTADTEAHIKGMFCHYSKIMF